MPSKRQLLERISELERRIIELEKRNEELEKRLLAYENAHTPPSLRRRKKRKDEEDGVHHIEVLETHEYDSYVVAYAVIAQAHAFYGTATVNGTNANSTVSAYVDGDLGGTFNITTAGQYGLLAVAADYWDFGEQITFKVDGEDAEQVYYWVPGVTTELNLTAWELSHRLWSREALSYSR